MTRPRFPLIDLERGDEVDLCGQGRPEDFVRRHVIEEHIHEIYDEATDEFKCLPVRGVHVDCRGPVVEIGPYSVTPAEARLMATSLTILANAVDDGHRDAPPPDAADWPPHRQED